MQVGIRSHYVVCGGPYPNWRPITPLSAAAIVLTIYIEFRARKNLCEDANAVIRARLGGSDKTVRGSSAA